MTLTITKLPDARYGFRKSDGTFLYMTETEVLAFDTIEKAQDYLSPPVLANARLIKSSTGKEHKHGD